MKKEVSVELLRILACLIVIGVHTCLNVQVNDKYILSRIYIACLLADGVAVFWLITGFFLFNSDSYSKLLKKVMKTIIVPMFVASVFAFYFGGILIENKTLAKSLYHSKDEYISIFKTLLTWRNPVKYMEHLWYLYIYGLLMLIFPVLKSFVKYLDENTSREKWFLIISAGILILNDLTENKFCEFSHYSINGLFPATVEVIWGHILYKYRARFKSFKTAMISLIFFLALNLLRAILQFHAYNIGASNHILYWYSMWGILCAASLMFCVVSIAPYISDKVYPVIRYIGRATFLVYLIHQIVNQTLESLKIKEAIMFVLQQHTKGNLFEIIYTGTMIIVVFMITLVISVIIQVISKGVLQHIGKRA